MKKLILPLIVLLLLISCKNKESKSEINNSNNIQDGDYQVTFVELGSVKCIPCKAMKPIMDDIEREYAGKVNVVFHDVWTPEGKAKAEPYKIKVIPTQIFLDKDGNEYFRHEGFFAKEELVKVLQMKL